MNTHVKYITARCPRPILLIGMLVREQIQKAQRLTNLEVTLLVLLFVTLMIWYIVTE
jgi:hypothetical protein